MSVPAEWRSPSSGAAIDVSAFSAFDANHLPDGVLAVKGEPAGIRMPSAGGSAGPTGSPWVDSNGWRIRLARLLNPGRTIWVETEVPKMEQMLRVERYLMGVADAGAHGGAWVLNFDEAFRQGVTSGTADGRRDWDRVQSAVRFFDQHAAWKTLPPRAVLAVVSDFRGDNEFLSGEILNLASRQQIPYLLVDKTAFKLPPGLKAVVYADQQPPSTAARTALAGFVQAGGMLVTGNSWGKVAATALPSSPTLRYLLFPFGQGKIAQSAEMDDPYLVAADTLVLLGRRNDVVRLWNGTSLGVYPTGDLRRTVVHLINYSARPGMDPVSLWVAGTYRTARLYTFEAPQAARLEVNSVRGGTEVHLPPFAVYAAVEVGQEG